MRHGDKVNNLGRKTAHRHALMMNLGVALITHKRIFTTLAKAKALRGYIEPMISKSKDNTTHNRRIVFSSLEDKVAVTELFNVIGPKVGSRPGGYTRVIKTGFRAGDAAEMAMIELVDFNEIYTQNKNTAVAAEPKKKTRRSSAKKAAATDATGEEGATKAPAKKKAAAKKKKAADDTATEE
ncbi:MAG TPA: 50S ribosomal protein L17 [Chitinophagales bacterium]|nr:50S ribosomal protein L17 [Chitinophagales bacterium]